MLWPNIKYIKKALGGAELTQSNKRIFKSADGEIMTEAEVREKRKTDPNFVPFNGNYEIEIDNADNTSIEETDFKLGSYVYKGKDGKYYKYDINNPRINEMYVNNELEEVKVDESLAKKYPFEVKSVDSEFTQDFKNDKKAIKEKYENTRALGESNYNKVIKYLERNISPEDFQQFREVMGLGNSYDDYARGLQKRLSRTRLISANNLGLGRIGGYNVSTDDGFGNKYNAITLNIAGDRDTRHHEITHSELTAPENQELFRRFKEKYSQFSKILRNNVAPSLDQWILHMRYPNVENPDPVGESSIWYKTDQKYHDNTLIERTANTAGARSRLNEVDPKKYPLDKRDYTKEEIEHLQKSGIFWQFPEQDTEDIQFYMNNLQASINKPKGNYAKNGLKLIKRHG